MLLSCDCYPGCWGDHSAKWTHIAFNGCDPADIRAVVRAVVPYGSYVEMNDGIRVEHGYEDKVKKCGRTAAL